MKKILASAVAAALLAGTASTTAFAFNDLDGVPEANQILELRDRGIVSGIDGETFAPDERMTAQTVIPLIVKGIGLNLDRFRFMKAPVASDYFANVGDDAWYAESFVIAQVNGLPIPADIDPAAEVTREQFAQWLMSAVHTTGDYPMIRMYVAIEDEAQVTEGYMSSIQELLLTKIAELGEDRLFRPQEEITRAEAAGLVGNAIRFIEERKEALESVPPVDDPIQSGEVTATVEAVNDDIAMLTLGWGEKPHAGWSIVIEGIDFTDEDSAVVRYRLQHPDPDGIYAQVITEPKASAYLSSQYTDIQYQLTGEWNNPEDQVMPIDDTE